MDGISRPFGGDSTFQWDGESLLLAPLDLSDFATIENHMLNLRRRPLYDQAGEMMMALPEALGKQYWEPLLAEARALNMIPMDDVLKWLDTPHGMAYSLWMQLSKRYPGKYKLHDCEMQILKATTERLREIKQRQDQASGIDPAGNSTGPSAA